MTNKDSISLRDVYEVVNRLESKMDERLSKVETKVDALEDFKSKTLGVLSIASFALSGLFTFIWKKIEG